MDNEQQGMQGLSSALVRQGETLQAKMAPAGFSVAAGLFAIAASIHRMAAVQEAAHQARMEATERELALARGQQPIALPTTVNRPDSVLTREEAEFLHEG